MSKKQGKSGSKNKRPNSDGNLQASLQQAENLLRSNRATEIISCLLPLKTIAEQQTPPVFAFYNRLLAFGYVHQQSYSEAEQLCQEGLSRDSDQLDYYFILCYIHLSLREYDKALTTYNLYCEKYDQSSIDKTQFSSSSGYQSQLHNFGGSANMEMRDFEQAIEKFKLAKKLDPGNHLPYLNLIKLLNNQRKYDTVKDIIQEGLKKCREIQELRMLESTVVDQPTISACMIVKNEEEMLPECLDSIRDWVDEIIVVDTGSTDKTVAIAESYGAKVYHQEWEGNFSKHRNYSVELATSDWIFIIDADERMNEEDISKLRSFLNQDDIQIISINVYNVYGKREETTTFLPSVRFWRKEAGLKYEGIVHNLLNLGMEHPVVRADVRLKHLGYDLSPDKMKQKFERTKALLEKQLEENPDSIFALFNYAQLLKGDKSRGDSYPTQNIPQIKKAAGRAVELSDPSKKKERHLYLMCLDQLAWASFYGDEFEDAEKYIHQALQLKPNYLDPLLLAGHLYARQEQWEEAKKAYREYLNVHAGYNPETETDPLILAHINSRASAYYSLGLIAERENNPREAKSYYLKALEANAGFIETNSRLAQLYARENDFENAKKYFSRQLDLSDETEEALLGLALIYQREEQPQLAEEYFKKAVTLNAFETTPKIKYAQFLINRHRETEAEQVLESIQGSETQSSALKQLLAESYYQVGKYDKAVSLYKVVTEQTEGDAELWNDFANCYFKMKQLDEAIPLYEKALKLNPTSAIINRNLGLAYADNGNYEAGVEYLDQYIKLDPNDLGVTIILGELYVKRGQYDSALQYLEQYLRKQPQDLSALLLVSDCYLNMGHQDSAIMGYKKILELKPDFKPARERLNEIEFPVNALEN